MARAILLTIFLTFTLAAFAAAQTAPNPAPAAAPAYPQRWNYVAALIGTDEEAETTISWLKQSKAAGCSHICLVAGRTARLHEAGNDEVIARIHKVRDAAAELGLKLIYTALPTGYASQYPHFDGNLFAGVPVKDEPFVVQGGKIVPDPSAALPIANAGFEQNQDNTFPGWTEATMPGQNSFVDTEIKHTGNASWKIAKLDEAQKLDKRKGPSAGITQKFKVKPFQYYKVSYWCRSIGGIYPNGLTIASDKARKGLIFSGIPIKRDKNNDIPEWTKAEVFFNTLDSAEITLHFSVSGGKPGTVWIDDMKIEPAPPMLIIRRPACPLKVTSEDGQTVYEEGKDFKPLADPLLSEKPFKGEFDTTHEVPFVTADGSRLKDGQKLLVSYYHTMQIGWDQHVLSMQEPKIFEIFQQELKNAFEHWKPAGIMLNYDEIRMGGWEVEPDGQQRTPGQILARHVQQTYAMVKKQSPEAEVWTWSDMFTPLHNARPYQEGKKINGYYWLVNGNWDGAWEGLPKDIGILNWYAPDAASIKF